MRAASEDYNTAQLMGINVNNTITLTFAIGCALAGIGSFLYCMAYPAVSPTMGCCRGSRPLSRRCWAASASFQGAMLGGVVMGIAESLTKAYFNAVKRCGCLQHPDHRPAGQAYGPAGQDHQREGVRQI